MSNKNGTRAQEQVKKTCDAETQTESGHPNYIPLKVLSGFQLESAFPNFFWKPQMVGLLLALCAVIGYFALEYSQDYNPTSFIANSRMYTSSTI